MASFAILSKEVSDPRRMLGPASPSLPPPPPHAPTTAQGLAVGLLPFGLPYRYCTGHPRQPRLPRLPRRDAGPHPPFINTTPAAASRACPQAMPAVLEFCLIKRKDTGDWAFPGGMVDAGEEVWRRTQYENLSIFFANLRSIPSQTVGQFLLNRRSLSFQFFQSLPSYFNFVKPYFGSFLILHFTAQYCKSFEVLARRSSCFTSELLHMAVREHCRSCGWLVGLPSDHAYPQLPSPPVVLVPLTRSSSYPLNLHRSP